MSCYRISVSPKDVTKEKRADQLKIGELAVIGGQGIHRGHIVMGTEDGMISLSDPSSVWRFHTSNIPVVPFEPGKSVTLTAI